jgi:hypothetical protein
MSQASLKEWIIIQEVFLTSGKTAEGNIPGIEPSPAKRSFLLRSLWVE